MCWARTQKLHRENWLALFADSVSQGKMVPMSHSRKKSLSGVREKSDGYFKLA